jgi:hypothetical protein
MKERNSETFVPMAEAAGVRGNGAGLTLAGARLTPLQGLRVEVSNQYVNDVFNTAFAQIEYAHAFHRDFVWTLSGQYTDQRAVGDALLRGSKFRNWVTAVGGARAQLHYHDFTVTTAFAVTGRGNNVQTPFGQYPGFLHMLLRDFDRAGEVAWMAGVGYDLSRWVAETKVAVSYAQGTNAVSPTRRTPQPDIREYDFGVEHRAPRQLRDPPALRRCALRPGAAELELDVVGVAKDEDADAEGLPEIADLAVRDTMAIQDLHGVVQRGAGGDLEAHVIEPDAILVEAIALHRLLGPGMGADAEPHLAVAQERAGVQVHELLEAEHLGVEGDRAIDVGDGEPEMVDALGGDVLGHACLLVERNDCRLGRRGLSSGGPRCSVSA